MVHAPLLSTDLFKDLSSVRTPSSVSKSEPFNLFKLLFLREEYEQIVDIYEAFYAPESEPDYVVSGQSSKRPSLGSREQDRLQEIRLKYSGLIKSEPTPEEDYWAAFAWAATGHSQDAERLFNKALIGGYQPAAILLASFAHDARELERAQNLLQALQPFDTLTLWDRVLAYRE